MQAEPIFEWQRLSEQYRGMSENELRELAADFADLTETAQQALRGELRSRGLGDPLTPNETPQASTGALPPSNAPDPILDRAAAALGADPHVPNLMPDAPDTQEQYNGPHEYTWKTLLCECETAEQAWQIQETLRLAGIDSWIDSPTKYSRYAELDLTNSRVLVAADQLEQARAVVARPIPQEIVEESEMKVPDFTPPVCPKCGASDPVLEGVDPSNTWRCDQCGERWSDPVTTAAGGAQNPG